MHLRRLLGCVPPFTHSALKMAVLLMMPALRCQLHMNPHGSTMHLSKKISRLVTNAHNRARRPCKRWDTPRSLSPNATAQRRGTYITGCRSGGLNGPKANTTAYGGLRTFV